MSSPEDKIENIIAHHEAKIGVLRELLQQVYDASKQLFGKDSVLMEYTERLPDTFGAYETVREQTETLPLRVEVELLQRPEEPHTQH